MDELEKKKHRYLILKRLFFWLMIPSAVVFVLLSPMVVFTNFFSDLGEESMTSFTESLIVVMYVILGVFVLSLIAFVFFRNCYNIITVQQESLTQDKKLNTQTPGVTSVPEETSQQAKVCSHCGNPLQPGQAFCPHCGSRVEAADESVGLIEKIKDETDSISAGSFFKLIFSLYRTLCIADILLFIFDLSMFILFLCLDYTKILIWAILVGVSVLLTFGLLVLTPISLKNKLKKANRQESYTYIYQDRIVTGTSSMGKDSQLKANLQYEFVQCNRAYEMKDCFVFACAPKRGVVQLIFIAKHPSYQKETIEFLRQKTIEIKKRSGN